MNNRKELELVIEDFKNRGVFFSCANPDNFLALEDEQRCAYIGIDCTADSLHIGHLLPMMQAVRLARSNFKIIILLGGATSKIGDPSDKLKERPIISKELLSQNQRKIEEQIRKIFSRKEEKISLEKLPLTPFFKNDKPLLASIYKILNLIPTTSKEVMSETWEKYLSNIWPSELKEKNLTILNNQDWLEKLSFIDFIDNYGRNITINYLLAKETIKQRNSSENGLSFSAFSYSLLQAYDFLYLYKNYNCHGQLGASDQWGNFTTGLKIIKSFSNENKCFALSFNLIVDDNGKKLSKSDLGTKIVWLDREKTPFKTLFDYFNNMSDEKAIEYIKKFSFLSIEQIAKLLELNNPKSLRIIQRVLTELFFFLIYKEEGLKWIQENAVVNQKRKNSV